MKASLKKKVGSVTVHDKAAPQIKPAARKKPLAQVKKRLQGTPLVRAKKAATSKSKKVQEVAEENQEVVVPSVAGLRLLEKVDIYRLWYENDLSTYMSNTAKVGGYVFILLGTLFASSSYILDKNSEQFAAAIVCSEEICSDINNADLPIGSPLVTFVNSLPDELLVDTDIVLKVENSSEVIVLLTATLSGEVTTLSSIEKVTENEYRYLIPAKNLTPSTYQMSAEVVTPTATYKFKGPTFAIPNPTSVEDAVMMEGEGEEIAEEEPTTPADTDQNSSPNEATEPVTSQEISSESNIEEDVEVTETKSTNLVSLKLENINGAEFLRIKTGDLLPQSVEVHSKLEFGEETIFLGLATLVQGEWIFSLSALDLPRLDLLLFSSFTVNDVTYQSEGVIYQQNEGDLREVSAETDEAILAQKIELALLSSSLDITKRINYFSQFASSSKPFFDSEYEELFASKTVLHSVDEKLAEVRESLDILLARYGSAIQGGSKYLISLADKMLTTHYRSLSTTIATEADEKAITPTLYTVLALRYQALKNEVSAFENELKQTTSNLTSRDSDFDGLSDFDEITIYQTNPSSSDSDADTVVDGVEIMQNFNPLLSDVVGLPNLNQISEEVIFNELLSITSVEPVVVRGLEHNEEDVYALITGKGIPNTFITLLNYSSSTIGIIKTNQAGDFSYTLEKQFEDGDHELVAVLSDNTGNIVASSKPYHFTKTSKNFAAAASFAQQPAFEQSNDEQNLLLTSTTMAAFAVVTFGFILLLLGQAIRTRKNTDSTKIV